MIKKRPISESVSEYVSGVLDGEIVAGELVRAAVERYERDCAQEDWEYYFDEKAAEHAVNFFPRNLRHSIGGTAGQPFELMPFQLFIVWNLFGWKRTDGTRRFRKAFLSMARKNGKSTLAAGIALYMVCEDRNPKTKEPEGRAEVLLAATQRQQAEIIYKEILAMIARSEMLEPRAREYKALPARIVFHENEGYITALGSDQRKDGFSPHLAILDEIHAFRKVHQPMYETLLTAGGFRDQPLVLSVTTAGDDTSYIWQSEWDYAKSVVENKVADESLFAMCFEIDQDDDPLDPEVWPKANPNLGDCLKYSYLEQQAKEAGESALKLNMFTRYHTNRGVGSTGRAFDSAQWKVAAGELSDWSEADSVTAGFDIGGYDDLSSWSSVARFQIGTDEEEMPLYRYEVKTQSYLSGDCERDLSQPPWCDWIKQKLLKVVDNPTLALQEDLLNECRENHVQTVGFDQYNGLAVAESFAHRGITIGKIPQNYAYFHEPIQAFRRALIEGRIVHDGSPLLAWMVGNAISKVDHNEREMLSKKDSSGKIDAVVAMLMAFRLATVAKPRARGPLYIF